MEKFDKKNKLLARVLSKAPLEKLNKVYQKKKEYISSFTSNAS